MTSKYIIEFIDQAKGRFRVVYKNGKFSRLERMTGELTQAQHKALMTVIPKEESAIDYFQKQWNGKVLWNSEKGSDKFSLFNEMVGAYKSWYFSRHDLDFVMTPISGKAMKQIIEQLKHVCSFDQEVLDVWNQILSNWEDQDLFYKKQDQLKQINGNLNIILKVIKHGKNESGVGAKSSEFADKFRK